MTEARATLLARVGTALHGDQWQSPLARDLGVNLRTMQRWAAGQNPVHPRVWADVAMLLGERDREITGLFAEVTAAAG